jgi:segregation and condensation protein B
MKEKELSMQKNAEADQLSVDLRSHKREEGDGTDDYGPVDSELENIIEAALYASKSPLGIKHITAMFPDDAQPSKVDIQNVITGLQQKCEHRGIELRRIGTGWRFQTKEKYSPWLRKLGGNKTPRYSRALLETLSIIAYRQPVTRGDIEEIRGVGVSSDTIRTLEERNWVAQIGHRDVPGRPALFGTTQGFLEYFNMTSLRDLPELMDKRALGEIAKDMNLTLPMDGVQDNDEAARRKEELSEKADVIELHPEIDDSDDELESIDEHTTESDLSALEDSDIDNANDVLDPDER